MISQRRNIWLCAALVVVLAVGAAVLPSALWLFGLAAVLGLAGVVLLRGERWRTGSLLVAALAVGFVLLDAIAGWLSPAPMGVGVVRMTDPKDWTPADPLLGYRPRPGIKVLASATFGAESVYRVTYTIGPTGARATPPAPAGADTYIFLGDSFVFGEGLADDQHLAAQFAKARDFKVRTVTFAAPGYGPNHLVRALETGLLDGLKGQPVKAVVIWIIPAHLARVTGDGSWLGSSPGYVLDDGVPRHTGSFSEHRWRNPLAGLAYLAGEQFPFIKATGARQREAEQAELFVALLTRLRELARERFGAPLVAIYSWPDIYPGISTGTPGPLEALLARIRQTGVPLLSVDNLTRNRDMAVVLIPHDGHPSAFTNELIAGELKRRLSLP